MEEKEGRKYSKDRSSDSLEVGFTYSWTVCTFYCDYQLYM